MRYILSLALCSLNHLMKIGKEHIRKAEDSWNIKFSGPG